jgi:hypothetical protein
VFVYQRIPIFDNKGEDLLVHMPAVYDFIERVREEARM